jgi:hypothetical protein
MMNPPTIVVLCEVSGVPKVKMDLPVLRAQDKVALHFRVKRLHAGRSEVLDVTGDFRVSAVSFNAKTRQQTVEVETVLGIVPSWRAIKRAPEFRRVIPPARSPRTVVA